MPAPATPPCAIRTPPSPNRSARSSRSRCRYEPRRIRGPAWPAVGCGHSCPRAGRWRGRCRRTASPRTTVSACWPFSALTSPALARHRRQTRRRGPGQLLASFDRRPRLPCPPCPRARPGAGPGARCPPVARRASGQGRAPSGRRRLLPPDRRCPVVGRPQAGTRCPYRGGPHRPGHQRALLSDLGASGWPRRGRGGARAVRRHSHAGRGALRSGAVWRPPRTAAPGRPPERHGPRPVAQVRGATRPACRSPRWFRRGPCDHRHPRAVAPCHGRCPCPTHGPGARAVVPRGRHVQRRHWQRGQPCP